jgi:hypothetical protein
VLTVALDQYIAACASNDYCRSDLYVFLGNGYVHLTDLYMVIFHEVLVIFMYMFSEKWLSTLDRSVQVILQEVLGEFLETDSLMDMFYFW